MKVFFITDNKSWFYHLESWIENYQGEAVIYCSPSGARLFSEEIKCGKIKVLDLKNELSTVIDYFNVGISCHCKQIFPKALVETIQCFNFHPGYNPQNRGWFPQVFSIINKLPAGATLHKMDSEIDHGPIVSQKLVPINSWDTSWTVYQSIMQAEFEIFDLWIERLLSADYPETPPSSEGNYNSMADFVKLCEIDLDKLVTMADAIDYFRAMSFEGYDNAFFYDDDGRKIFVSINLKVEK